MTTIIGIDPASNAAAAWTENREVKTVKFDGNDLVKIQNALPKIENAVVYMESPYLGKNVHTYGMLNRIFGKIEGECELRGWKVIEIAPRTWHPVTAINGCVPINRDKIKAASRWFCEKHLHMHGLTEDECDAVCIMHYGERNHALESKKPVQPVMFNKRGGVRRDVRKSVRVNK